MPKHFLTLHSAADFSRMLQRIVTYTQLTGKRLKKRQKKTKHTSVDWTGFICVWSDTQTCLCTPVKNAQRQNDADNLPFEHSTDVLHTQSCHYNVFSHQFCFVLNIFSWCEMYQSPSNRIIHETLTSSCVFIGKLQNSSIVRFLLTAEQRKKKHARRQSGDEVFIFCSCCSQTRGCT